MLLTYLLTCRGQDPRGRGQDPPGRGQVFWPRGRGHASRLNITAHQGNVLSPYLFSVYIREVSSSAIDSGIGCFVGSVCCNIILYADDMALLAPSWKALQNLINTCDACTRNLDMKCNASKSVTMIFSPYKAMRRVDYALNSAILY